MAPDATPTMKDADFSQMGIYIDGRTKNELDELLRTKPAAEVNARDLYALSCMHYMDDEPMQNAAAFFNLSDASEGASHKVLDFGAGFAGDARLIAEDHPACEVTCVEVQPHIHAAAEQLTSIVGIADRCKHQCVDVFEEAVRGAPFDHMLSVLVVLHIPDRDALWKNLARALKPGGEVYVEDYFARAPLTAEDKRQLAGPVACPYLPSEEEYKKTLEGAGFVDVEWEVMNDRWLPFVERRLAAFRAAEARNRRVHGEAMCAELDLFYRTVKELFERGNLGGVRIRARKAK